jgi:serpin B
MYRLLIASFAVLAMARALPAAEQADVAALVKGNNAFALDLYRQLRDKPGNLFLSPYSISTALGMTSAGARGDTLKEMTTALHFPEQAKLHPAFTALIHQVNGEGKKKMPYQLSTVNALWGQKDYPFQAEFVKLTRDHYGAGLREVDFAGDTEGAGKAINDWVERETQNRIKELIGQKILSKDTRLVLTNAIYFKAGWASKFDKDSTKDEPFFLANGEKAKAPLMHQTQDFPYYAADDLQALELPYIDKDLSMLVLLPKKAAGLAALEKDLTADRLATIVEKLRRNPVNLSLPRFRMTDAFELKKPLEALGMKKAFDAAADFSGLNGGKEELYLSAVLHKTFVAVDEEGTEAAGATAVVVKPKDGGPRETANFRADHPFLFLIRDTRNGSVLFLGRLSDPTK